MKHPEDIVLSPHLPAELAAVDAVYFSEYVFGTKPAWFHQEWLRDTFDPDITRLAVIAPPGHLKTTFFSVIIPCLWLGLHPEHAIILTSNTASQAWLNAGAVRATIEYNDKYHKTFPWVKPNIKKWGTDNFFIQRKNYARIDPSIFATGVGGPIQGRHAELIVVDDPTDAEIAASDTLKQKQRDWWRNTLLQRIKKDTKVILVSTRWCEDDLFTEALRSNSQFILRHYKAILDEEKHEVLWPEEYPYEYHEQQREEITPRIFNTMYQGDPEPGETALFQREHVKLEKSHPKLWYVAQAWDMAQKEKETSDYTACITGGLDESNKIHIIDMFRARMDAPNMEGAIITQSTKHQPKCIIYEDKASATAVVQYAMRKHLLPIIAVTPDRSKVARAQFVVPLLVSGQVSVLEDIWTEVFLNELIRFPGAKYDDQVDAFVYLLMHLAMIAMQSLSFEQAVGVDDGKVTGWDSKKF